MIKPKGEWTLKRLQGVPIVTPPRAGDNWKGIGHLKLALMLIESVSDLGPTRLQVGLSKDRADIAATVMLQDMEIAENTYGCVGVVSSNARRLSFRSYVGAYELGRAYGIPLLSGSPRRRHNATINFELVMSGVGYVARESQNRLIAQRDKLMRKKFQRELAEHYFVQASTNPEMNCLSNSRAIAAIKKIQSSPISGWELMNLFCEQNAKAPVVHQMENAQTFRTKLLQERVASIAARREEREKEHE